MEFLSLLIKTIAFRPYVFVFLAAFLFSAGRLIGRRRTGYFMIITWIVAFVCEFSSTRTGIPFGWYHYTGSTMGQELYMSDVPLMDSLSFPFLLYASYCMALAFLLPSITTRSSPGLIGMEFQLAIRTGWPIMLLAILFFVFLDVVIDPVALRGDRWFLGKIYYYPEPGVHFGVPIANYIGWGVVGFVAVGLYRFVEGRLPAEPQADGSPALLIGCALYYAVLVFNLAVTFWIGEPLIGTTGVLMYLPITALVLVKLAGRLPPDVR